MFEKADKPFTNRRCDSPFMSVVEQWSRNLEVPGSKPAPCAGALCSKALISITKSLREDLNSSVPWLFTKHILLTSQVKQTNKPLSKRRKVIHILYFHIFLFILFVQKWPYYNSI